jgi:hypothetical protein
MSRWANDEEAPVLLKRSADQTTHLEATLLAAARAEYPRTETLRVISLPGPGEALIVVRNPERVGHAVGGYVGLGVEAEGFALANLKQMAGKAALELREKASRPAAPWKTIQGAA